MAWPKLALKYGTFIVGPPLGAAADLFGEGPTKMGCQEVFRAVLPADGLAPILCSVRTLDAEMQCARTDAKVKSPIEAAVPRPAP